MIIAAHTRSDLTQAQATIWINCFLCFSLLQFLAFMFVGYHKSMLNVKVRLNCPVSIQTHFSLYSFCFVNVSVFFFFFNFSFYFFFHFHQLVFIGIGILLFHYWVFQSNAHTQYWSVSKKRNSLIIIFSTVMVIDCKYSKRFLLIKIVHQFVSLVCHQAIWWENKWCFGFLYLSILFLFNF